MTNFAFAQLSNTVEELLERIQQAAVQLRQKVIKKELSLLLVYEHNILQKEEHFKNLNY